MWVDYWGAKGYVGPPLQNYVLSSWLQNGVNNENFQMKYLTPLISLEQKYEK